MSDLTEIMQYCRLCLVKNNVNVPIFEDSDNEDILLKITSCLPVTVTPDDELPKNICNDCRAKLDVAYSFRNSSAAAEKQLHLWLSVLSNKNGDRTKKEIIKEEPDDGFVAVQESISYESDKGSTSKARKQTAGNEPPPKRARRAAAMKKPVNIPSESDEDLDDVEPLLTKEEDDSDISELDAEDNDPTYEEIPSANVDQPGPSGVGKEGVESPRRKGKNKKNKNKKKKSSSPQKEKVSKEAASSKCTVQLTKLNIEQLKLKLPENHLKDLADKFKCIICKVFLKDHFKDGQYKCCKCDREKMYSKFKLARHGYHFHYLNKTEPLDMIKCKECDELFERLIDQKRHMIETHKKNKNAGEVLELTCELCYDEFESKEELDEHMELHDRLAEEENRESEEESDIVDEEESGSEKNDNEDDSNADNDISDIKPEISQDDFLEDETISSNNADNDKTGDADNVQMPLISNEESIDYKNQVKCSHCNQMFDKESLIKHNKHCCSECDKFTTCNAGTLKQHYLTEHQIPNEN